MATEGQKVADGESGRRKARTIRTEYKGLVGKKRRVVAITHSAWPNNATRNCFAHMQVNRYGAQVAEVYDVQSGELHAQFVRYVDGSIKCVFKRDPRDFVTRDTLKHFQNGLVHG